MSVRHIYLVEDEQGKCTAHMLMRGAKLQAIDLERGKVYRITVTTSLSTRELSVALYNHTQEFEDERTHVYDIVDGNLREPVTVE